MRESTPVIFLPGAGAFTSRTEDLPVFRTGPEDPTQFEMIGYPGWQRYVADGFSPEALIEELAAEIEAKIPHGPIRIIGLSIGGHFGYAVAVHLQAKGRKIGGLCAIDTFMTVSAAPAPQWGRRALHQGMNLLSQRRIGAFLHFLRSLFWRAINRAAESHLPALLGRLSPSGRLPRVMAFDPLMEYELTLRLMLRKTAPWVGSLDSDPVALNAPAVLLRSRNNACDDDAWRRRCPAIKIVEVPGDHRTLFDPENIGSLHAAFIDATREWRQ